MQHPDPGHMSSIPQTGYPIRGQSMPTYTTTQNQTQIHQLLQQPHASSQMMQRGNISPQMMQRERVETSPQLLQREVSPQMMQRRERSPQMMQRGEISPQMMQRGEISPQMMQRGEISPQMMQRGQISPQMMPRGQISPQIMQRGEVNPQIMQRGEVNPQLMQRGEVNPQIMQRRMTSPQFNSSVSPHAMQRGMGTQMNQNPSLQVMQTPNNQMMPTGEFNQKVMYTGGNGSQMIGGTSPQLISPNGLPPPTHSSANSFQRSPMPSDNQVHGKYCSCSYDIFVYVSQFYIFVLFRKFNDVDACISSSRTCIFDI
jgi:hypothetical protein